MARFDRIQYYRRVFGAYVLPGKSQLSFWHDSAEINANALPHVLGEYYMVFAEKARYDSPLDADGIPLLDYHGDIGLQHNPIAVAQWGLGNCNLFRRHGDPESRGKFLRASDWLCANLRPNRFGISVWTHNFDWEYREELKSPWYSALAQGQGISLLVRAHAETNNAKYLDAAMRAYQSFTASTESGGVSFADGAGGLWFEEYIVSPPSHILNGFIWAAWGVYDYCVATGSQEAGRLFDSAIQTLTKNMHRYDLGFWSSYELSGTLLPMIASPFYHRLHIAQLRVMHQLTANDIFADYAARWENYARSRSKRTRALCYKSAFKLCYY